jgi:hypothetical protein
MYLFLHFYIQKSQFYTYKNEKRNNKKSAFFTSVRGKTKKKKKKKKADTQRQTLIPGSFYAHSPHQAHFISHPPSKTTNLRRYG